jgi:uncharacterized RDD family membrane protein YckC
MKCVACGWSNPASYTHCFSCNASLSAGAGAAAAGSAAKSSSANVAATGKNKTFANAPAKTPWDPRSAPSARAPNMGEPLVGHVADDAVIASKWHRVFAAGIDLVVMVVLSVIAIVSTVGLGVMSSTPAVAANDSDFASQLALLAGVLAFIAIMLPALMDSFTAGSFGRRLFNVRVINARGERPGIFRSVLRHVAKYVLHFTLPLGMLIIERLFFQGQSLHDLLMSTRVVDRRASAAQVEEVVAHDFARTGAFKVIAWILAGIAALFFAVVAISVLTATPNATRDTVKVLAKSAKSLAKQSENYFYAQGAFPASLSAMGLSKPPEGFEAVQFNETNGAFTLTIAENAATTLSRKTITLYPEFKKKKSAGTISKWRCGSKDIARDDQSSSCNHDITALN